MPLPYYNNIPQATDIPAQSQPLMLTNFGSIDTLIGVDHVTFAGAPDGAHNKVSLVTQGAAPVWPAGINFGFYATAAGIFLHNTVNGADIDVTLRTHATPAGADFWRVILPSGLIISTGTAQTTGATGLITVPLANVPNDFISSIVNVARDHVTTGQRYYAYNYALTNAPGNAAVQFYVFNWAANAPAPIHTAVYFTVIGY